MIDLSIWKYIAGHSIWLVDFKEWKHHLKCLCLCIWQPQLLHKRGRLTHVMILLHIFSLVGRKSMKNCFHRLWYYLVLTPGPKSRVSPGGPGRRTWDLGGGLESRDATLPALPLHNFLSSRNSILNHMVAYLEFWHPEILKSWNPAHQRETHLEDVQGESGCSGS